MKTEKSGATTPFYPVRCVRDGIFIRVNEYYKKFLYADILWIEASGSYSYFHLRDKPRLIVACRLGVVDGQLPVDYFARVHRGFILNLHYIDTLAGNSFKIGEHCFPIGDSFRKKVLSCLNILEISRGRQEEGEE